MANVPAIFISADIVPNVEADVIASQYLFVADGKPLL